MMFTHSDRHHAMSDTGHVRVYIDKTESADTLTENERDLIRAALIHGERAMAYAWGRQDESNPKVKDSVASDAFAAAYAQHAYRYLLGEIGSRNNIPTAYNLFRQGDPLHY
jgi:hypothetical protein